MSGLHLSTLTAAALLLAAAGDCAAARKERLELRHTAIELPGAPSAILAADLDGDGRQDLVVAVAITEWDRIGIEESAEIDDVDGLVEVLTIVPSLLDRRELWVFLGRDGGYQALAAPMILDRSVLSLDLGPPGLPVVALTDGGVAALRLTGDGDAVRAHLEPLLDEPPILARSGNFVSDLGLAHDLDGDGRRDLLIPTADGAAVYLSDAGGLRPEPASRLLWPAEQGPATARPPGGRLVRLVPLPEVRDVDGDGLPDLLLRRGDTWRRFHVLRSAGEGRFGNPLAPLGGDEPAPPATKDDADPKRRDAVVFFGDLDGDGIAEVVLRQDLGDDDGGMRREMRQAKRPPFRYRFHRTGAGLAMAAEPFQQLDAAGYAFDGDDEVQVPGGFQDLDGDGRLDLVTLTLDFSVLQAVRILTTHRISIGLDFHVWCQGDGGRFRPVEGLDLSGKFRLDLDDLRIGQLSQFAGDFDADGKADFVQMGRGRDVTIHRGRDGCAYPAAPDLTLRLAQEPKDLKLVQVRDLDADGRADLLIIQPQKVTEPGVTPPVRLDLYRSGGGG